jgi:hypothetical protein
MYVRVEWLLGHTVSADELHTTGYKLSIVVIASFKYKYHCHLPIFFAFTAAIDFDFGSIPSKNYGLWQTEQVISAKFQRKVGAVGLKIFRRAL